MKFNITYLRLAFLFSAVFLIWVKGFSQKEKDVNTFFKFLEEKNYSKAHLMFESSIILQFPDDFVKFGSFEIYSSKTFKKN